jgi:hypothetical protein
VSREYHGWAEDRMTALDVLLESFAISRSHLGRHSPVVATGQQILTLPPLSIGRHDMRDFSQTPRLIAAGREAGRMMVAAELRASARRPLESVEPHDNTAPAAVPASG